ncbi:transcription factor IIA subunit alpha [Kappamyces sp. JEL0829]|nr:transcription factor IIA subunit alpha [Kappamyces sp. JEL0829]
MSLIPELAQEIDELIIKNGLVAAKSRVPQLDGRDDDDDDDDEDDDGSELASDLDDDDDDENQKADHLILCQYEKVSRVKNKWKCILKDGIVNINGKDYLFNKANGEFEW